MAESNAAARAAEAQARWEEQKADQLATEGGGPDPQLPPLYPRDEYAQLAITEYGAVSGKVPLGRDDGRFDMVPVADVIGASFGDIVLYTGDLPAEVADDVAILIRADGTGFALVPDVSFAGTVVQVDDLFAPAPANSIVFTLDEDDLVTGFAFTPVRSL